MQFRIIEINGKYLIEEKSWLTFFLWSKWVEYGGSFGDSDIEFDTIDKAEEAINNYKRKPTKKIVKCL